jgi:SET domain-containing protein
MENIHEIRKLVRKTLSENAFPKIDGQSLPPERLKEISEYVDKRLSEFNIELRKLVIENNHPYINIYLKAAIEDLKKTISTGGYEILGAEEVFL